MNTDYNILKYKKVINEKDQEIKDSQKKIKILIKQVNEKNEHIKNLESILKSKNNNNNSSNYAFLNSNEIPILNYKNNKYYFFSKNESIKSNADYRNLFKSYEKLKKEHEELKKENDILYNNINCLTLEKNDVNKLLEQKMQEIKKLQNDKGIDREKKEMEQQIKKLKEINDKLLNEINYKENKNETITLEINELKENNLPENESEEKEQLLIIIKNLENDKKNLENKLKNLELELNEIKKINNNKEDKEDEEINKDKNENIIKQLNEKINIQKNENEDLSKKLREKELNYLTKITKLQETINKIKNNFIFLEEKNEIIFSLINKEKEISNIENNKEI